MTQPILRFIEGIDPDSGGRYLSQDEVNELVSTARGKGDWFAQWLATTPENARALSFRKLLNEALPKGALYSIFAVADGIPIVYDTKNPDNPLNKVPRALRFVTIVLPDSGPDTTDLSSAITTRTLCIVASAHPDGEVDGAFLQCASWDPDALGKRKGLMRFYQRDEGGKGWRYFGNSFNAFNAASTNRGPFDGHVGGAMIMKELTTPWTHWYSGGNANEFVESLGSTRDHGSLCDPHNALYDPLFTPENGPAFSLLTTAEVLEGIVEKSVSKWYIARFSANFIDQSTNRPLSTITALIQDWVGHILLSRAMNIAVCATSTAQVKQQAMLGTFPPTLFYNSHALQKVLPRVGIASSEYAIANSAYVNAVNALDLSLYYDDNSADPPTRRLAVKGTEGPFAIPIIEPGVEDYQGVSTIVTSSSAAELLPKKAIAAMLMVDFYNPMYSAKRAALMQYLPASATFDSSTKRYNILDQFVANVKASHAAQTPGTSEHEILQLLAEPDDAWTDKWTDRVNAYLARVHARLTGADAAAAVGEYMLLVEGRRRLYKGWEDAKPDGSGLDEFRLTLPIAAKPDPFTLVEMTEAGAVVPVPDEVLQGLLGLRGGGGEAAVAGARKAFGYGTGGCPAHARAAKARLALD